MALNAKYFTGSIVLLSSLAPTGGFAFEPASIPVGNLSLTPTIDIKTGHTDNLTSVETGEVSTLYTLIRPSLVLSGQKGGFNASITYSLEKGNYFDSSADNYLDHNLLGAGSMIFNSRNRLDLNAGFIQGHEARGSEDGGSRVSRTVPSEFDQKTLSGTYSYGGEEAKGRIELTAGLEEKKFTNNRTGANSTVNKDYDKNNLGAAFFYRIRPKTRLFVEVQQEQYDYLTSNKDNTTTKLLTGVTWEATGKTTGRIKVGHTNKEFDQAGLEDTSGGTWEASVIWLPKSYSQVTFTSSQNFDESTTSDDFIDRKSYGVNWRHSWNDKWATRAGFNVLDKNYNTSNRKDDINTINLGLDFAAKRWLNFSLDYNYTDQDSNEVGSSYKTNDVSLTVKVAL